MYTNVVLSHSARIKSEKAKLSLKEHHLFKIIHTLTISFHELIHPDCFVKKNWIFFYLDSFLDLYKTTLIMEDGL